MRSTGIPQPPPQAGTVPPLAAAVADGVTATSCRHLLHLADDLLFQILRGGDGMLLSACARTCSQLRYLVEDERLWESCVRQKWGWLVGSHATFSWQAMYARLHRGTAPRFVVVGSMTALQLSPHLHGGYLTVPIFAPPAPAAFALDSSLTSWQPLATGRHARNMAALVRHHPTNSLVAIGGALLPHHVSGTEPSTLASVEQLQLGGEQIGWSNLPSLAVSRCCAGAACDSRGTIYCVGGGDSMFAQSRAFASVEVLESLHGTNADVAAGWQPAPSMLEARCAHGCALSFSTGCLFAVGGYGGSRTREYLDTVERLEPLAAQDARWEPLPRLSVKRAGCGAVVGPDDRLYAVGGGPDGRRCWASLEALDTRVAAWDTTLAPCRIGRHYNACAFGPDGRLYVSGAFRHDGQLDHVEVYDPRADRWEDLPSIGVVVHFSAGAFIL